jgi:hypothetical protein
VRITASAGSATSSKRSIIVEALHQIAESGALGAARGLGPLLELVLEVGLALGAHHHGLDIVVVVDGGDLVVLAQHVLVEQVADRQILREVGDRHHGDDLLAVEIERQRPLDHHRGFDRRAVLVDPADPLGQARIGRIGAQIELRQHRRIRRLGAAPAHGLDLAVAALWVVLHGPHYAPVPPGSASREPRRSLAPDPGCRCRRALQYFP